MKKLFFIASTLLSIQLFGQKNLEIYNISGYTVKILNITTSVSGIYPKYSTPENTSFMLPATTGYYQMLNTSNPTRFPFNSTVSSPSINTWDWYTTSGSSPIPTNSTSAWILGSTQCFESLSVTVGGVAGQLTSFNVCGSDAQVTYSPSGIMPEWKILYYAYEDTDGWHYLLIIE